MDWTLQDKHAVLGRTRGLGGILLLFFISDGEVWVDIGREPGEHVNEVVGEIRLKVSCSPVVGAWEDCLLR